MERQIASDYCVYKHIVPDGRYYIGLTSNITNRWEHSGTHYKRVKLFYSCIEEYGWDNIKHIILHDNLTLIEAQELERKYITEAKSAGVSLNKNNGGSPGSRQKRGVEARKRLSEGHRGLHYKRSSPTSIRKDSKWQLIPVEIYKDGQLVRKFNNIHQAAREFGITRWSLMRSIRSGRPTKGGYLIVKI